MIFLEFSGLVTLYLFVDTIHQLVLSLVYQPTQFRVGFEPHLLDVLLTNETNMIENIEYCSGLGKGV